MQVRIESTYAASTNDFVELPNDIQWSDIEWWYVKWGTLFFKAKQETEAREIPMDSDITTDTIDFKRPMDTWVYEVDEQGEPISDEPIAEG